jgi:hypothetical protein
MDQGRAIGPAVWAGALAGIAGLVTFLVAHHAWIAPIWFVAPAGLVMAALGGAAVGSSYATLRPRLPQRPWTATAIVAIFAGVLAPAVVVAELRGPILAMGPDGGGVLLVPGEEAVVDVLVGLIGVSALMGATLGGLIGRSRRAALATSLAAVALAIGPGHNIPLLGGTPVVEKELAILLLVLVVSACTLVETEARLSRHLAPHGARTASVGQPGR